MAVVAKGFVGFLESLASKEIDLDSDSFKVMLLSSSATPDLSEWHYKSSVTNEISGSGYTAGGAELSSVTVTNPSSSNLLVFDAEDLTWSSATITARYAVIYDDTPGTDSAKPLVALQDFGEDKISSNGDFTIQWNVSGIFGFTQS